MKMTPTVRAFAAPRFGADSPNRITVTIPKVQGGHMALTFLRGTDDGYQFTGKALVLRMPQRLRAWLEDKSIPYHPLTEGKTQP